MRVMRPERDAIPTAATLLLLLGSAVLLAVSFPPVGWWWAAHVALAPLGYAAARAGMRSRRLLLLSILVFVGWWLVQARWLLPLGVPSWAGVAVVEGVMFALAIWGLSHLRRGLRMPMVLALPLVWVSLDFLRSQFPFGGFNWFALAHSQAPYAAGQRASWLAQSADLFGEPAVGLLVALGSGLAVDVALADRRDRPRLWTSTLVWVCLLALASGYGFWRVIQTDDVARPGPIVAVVQPSQPLVNTDLPTAEDDLQNWKSLTAATLQAATRQPSPALIVWPESSVPLPINDEVFALYPDAQAPREYRNQLTELAVSTEVPLLVGSSAITGDTRTNSVYLIPAQADGTLTRYDKMHLVPFGEAIPGSQTLPWLKTLVLKYFSPWDFDYTLTPGKQRVVFRVMFRPLKQARQEGSFGDPDSTGGNPSLRVVTPICFEDTVSRVCRRLVYQSGQKRADLIVNQTNDGWFVWRRSDGTFRPSTQNRQHLQIAVFRSIENRVPTARAVNTGVSGFIDSAGRIGPLVEVRGANVLVSGFASHQIEHDPRVTVYSRLGDMPNWLLACLTLALVVIAVARKRPVSR